MTRRSDVSCHGHRWQDASVTDTNSLRTNVFLADTLLLLPLFTLMLNTVCSHHETASPSSRLRRYSRSDLILILESFFILPGAEFCPREKLKHQLLDENSYVSIQPSSGKSPVLSFRRWCNHRICVLSCKRLWMIIFFDLAVMGLEESLCFDWPERTMGSIKFRVLAQLP